MDEPAQHIPPLDTQAIGGLVGRTRARVRRSEIHTAVGPLGVVMGNVDPKDLLQMSAAEHQRPVQALGRTVLTHRSATAFAHGARTGVRMTSMPSPANTASKLDAYFASRSLTRNRKAPPPVRSKARFLAAG
jgi:hypothetical protein